MTRAEGADRLAVEASRETQRLVALHEGARRMRALGERDERWTAYAATSRSLRDKAIALSMRGPVALVSEGGAGAAAIAKVLHDQGPGAASPFVILDAGGARLDGLLAALVGDARESPERAGWLEHAAGGTLVLEDLPALGHDAQVALVDALRTGTSRRLGAEHGYAVDVRVVVTMRDRPERFDLPRALLDMLSERTVRVPPLRERIEDLESLTLLSIDRACRVHGRAALGVGPEAALALRSYRWPGNLDELDAAIEHAVRRAKGTRIALDDLPAQVRAALADDLEEEYESDRPWRGDA
ncbi:MAG: sigma 54-interacting transcriptional regulator [Polyangiales bacterium]